MANPCAVAGSLLGPGPGPGPLSAGVADEYDMDVWMEWGEVWLALSMAVVVTDSIGFL